MLQTKFLDHNNGFDNGLSFIKVASTFIIMLLHFCGNIGTSRGGWAVFVDLFFLISGLLLANTFENKRDNPINYMKARYFRIYPYFIFGFVVYFIMLFIKYYPEFFLWKNELVHSIPEIFLLQVLGVNEWSTNHGAVWYLSVLMLASLIIYCMLYFKKQFFFLVSTVCVFLIYAQFYIRYNTIVVPWDCSTGVIGNPSFYRGIAAMTVGALIFYVSEYVKVGIDKMKANSIVNNLFLSIEILLLFLLVLISLRTDNVFVILAIEIALVFISWNFNHSNVLFQNRIIKYLNLLSLSLYINHPLFVDIGLLRRIPSPFFIRVAIYLLCVVVYSTISYTFINRFIFGKK